MIKEIRLTDYHLVKEFVETDIGRNYFILLGLASKKQVYDKIYGEYEGEDLKAVLFRRKSGVLQLFAPGEFDLDGFVSLISTLEYDALIGPRSYCDKFLDKGLFTSKKKGAYISKLDKDYIMEPFQNQYKIRDITVKDLDEIVELYKTVFQSFSSREIMEEKLKSKRGRGVCIEEDGKIISVAQTDFETKDGAIIVGVATNRDNRLRGLATKCLQVLCSNLINEGKDLYLQYDNLEAGKIYERLGFKNIDQVIHYGKDTKDIFQIFYDNRNEGQAEPMSKYMRNLFPFLGIKKPERRVLTKTFFKEKKNDSRIDWEFIFKCYDMPEREFQYLATEYMEKVKELFIPDDMKNIEKLITIKSWWDSVDAINNVVGHIAMKYPEVKEEIISDWMKSDIIWLIRISIIFQLKYKENTDTDFLERAIVINSQTTEFFINKAIGWILREYSKTNSKWVKEFIENNSLSKLSIREGSKYT